LSHSLSQLHKTSGAQVWRGAAVAAAATGILVLAWTFSWLYFGISMVWNFFLGALAWREVCYLGWLLVLGFASGIILSVKVKVLGGGLCAYGWVKILLYCLW
jgi:hypothetical protein